MVSWLFKGLLICLVLVAAEAEEASARLPLLRQSRQATTPTVVKLKRESRKGLVSNGADLIVYTADLRIGEAKSGRKAQDVRVVFDLSSGQVVVPSSGCRDVTCFKHRRYNKFASEPAQDINADGSPVHPTLAVVNEADAAKAGGRDKLEIGLDIVDLGPGEVKGEMIKEKVCLSTEHDEMKCTTLSIVAAIGMTDLPFRVLPNDGFVGLGLDGVALSPNFNFLKHFLADVHNSGHVAQQFGLFLGGEAGGEIAFGGYDVRRVQSPLAWVPVTNPEQGYWQMEILAVRVGNKTLDVCSDGGCRGLVDTGASQLTVPTNMATPLEEVLRTSLMGASGLSGSTDLQLVFHGATISVPASGYAGGPGCLDNPAACRPLISRHHIEDPIGRGVFVLGESVLRSYYTVFDAQTKRIGFGASSGTTAAMTAALLSGTTEKVTNSSTKQAPKMLFLIQVTTRRSVTKL